MQITGPIDVVVDGLMLASLADAEVQGVGGLEREDVVGSRALGYRNRPIAPGCTFTLAHTAGTSVSVINAITDATIQLLCDTGTSFVLRHAWCKKSSGPQGGKGEIKCEFGAMSIEEFV